MHTPENIIAMADAYIKVIFAGILLTMAYNVLSGILRGIGDSRTPLYFLILSSVLNIILDVVLIVYTGLEPQEPPTRQSSHRGVSAVLCFFYMYRKYDILRTRHEGLLSGFRRRKNMLAIGVPMALNYSITAIGTMIMQSAVNVFGSSVVAAFTAASRSAISRPSPCRHSAPQWQPTAGRTSVPANTTASTPACGRGLFLCFGAAATAAAICIFGGRFIVSWFVSNPSEEIFSSAMQYLTIASWFFLPLAMIFYTAMPLQGLDQGLIPMLSGVIELACRFGVIALVPASTGFFGVCFADPAAWPVPASRCLSPIFSGSTG